MRNLFVPVLGLVLLALWCAYCIRHHGPLIESLIESRARATLATPDLLPVSADGDGRDIVLTGSVATEELRTQAGEMASAARGVRSVDNQLVIVPGSSLTAVPRDGSYVLSGEVPSAEIKQRLLQAARADLGETEIIDELEISEDPSAAASFSAIPTAMTSLFRGVMAPGLELAGRQVDLTGTVASQSLKQSIGDRVAGLLPDFEVNNRIEVVERSATQIVNDLGQMLELRTIEFETNSAELTPRGLQVLTEVRNTLAQIPDTRIEISGHTDSRGNNDWNRELSRLRAGTVQDFLSATLNADRFTAIGLGSSRPVATNDTAEGRQRNRRIDFRILEEN